MRSCNTIEKKSTLYDNNGDKVVYTHQLRWTGSVCQTTFHEEMTCCSAKSPRKSSPSDLHYACRWFKYLKSTCHCLTCQDFLQLRENIELEAHCCTAWRRHYPTAACNYTFVPQSVAITLKMPRYQRANEDSSISSPLPKTHSYRVCVSICMLSQHTQGLYIIFPLNLGLWSS